MITQVENEKSEEVTLPEEKLTEENLKILNNLIELAEKGELVGEFTDIPNEVYHDIRCPGLSKTSLDKMDRSMVHHDYAKQNHKSSDALEFGCAFHDMILEPHIFKAENIKGSLRPEKEVPKFDRRTKVGKAAYAEFMENTLAPWIEKVQKPWDMREGHKTQWSDDKWDLFMGMKKTIDNHEVFQALFKDTEVENTYFWIDKKTGLLCKCRPDIINKRLGILIDLKSTVDASPKDFRKSIANFKYDKQASYYLTGVNEALGVTDYDTFIFAACEKSAPFELALYNLDEASIDVGKQLWERSLDKVLDIRKGKLVKGYVRAIQNINLPAWGFDVEAR